MEGYRWDRVESDRSVTVKGQTVMNWGQGKQSGNVRGTE